MAKVEVEVEVEVEVQVEAKVEVEARLVSSSWFLVPGYGPPVCSARSRKP